MSNETPRHLEDLDTLAAQAERRQKTQLAWTLGAVLVPAIAGATVLWGSYAAVDRAQADLDRVEGEITQTTQELKTQRDENTSLADANERLEAEIEVGTARYEELQESVVQIEARADSLEAQYLQRESEFEELQAWASGVREEIEDLRDRRESLTLAIEDLERDRELLQEENEGLRRVAETERIRAAELEKRTESAESALETAEAQITALSAREPQERHTIDWANLNSVVLESQRAARPLWLMSRDRERGLKWGLRNTPETGFSSSAYAASTLQKLGLLDGSDKRALASLPREPLEGRVRPRAGDIVVYENGYHLFYYRDGTGEEFVAGMTPEGIVTIDYETYRVPAEAVLRVPRR